MAAGRGLNKSRGLGSLIPPKKDQRTESPEKNISERTEVTTFSENPTVSSTNSNNIGINPDGETTAEAENLKETEADLHNAVVEVRLTEIVPNRKQPRKNFDEAAIEELAASIREHGIVTPLLVQKKGKYYELIAGERRWRAAKLAGLKTAPVLIRDFSDQQAAEIALIENIQREDLNAMEEAQAFRQLQEEFSLTQEEIAERVSRSRSAVANSLRLLKLEESVQMMVSEGKLSMGHARALLALENPEMQKLMAERVAEKDLSVRETEKLVNRLLVPKKTNSKKEPDEQLEAIYSDLEEQLRKAIGTRVSIKPLRGKKGRIEIEYYSNEDLERIMERLRQN